MNRYEDDSEILRLLKIQKDFTSPQLEKLAKDKNPNTRLAVAGNIRTPLATLELLSKDGDDDVRAGVGSNPNTSSELLEILSKDSDRDVRWAVALNRNTPVEILESLKNDAEPIVRKTAEANSTASVKNEEEGIEDNSTNEGAFDEYEDEEEIYLPDLLDDPKFQNWISRKLISFSEDSFTRTKTIWFSEGDFEVSPRTLSFLSSDENAIEEDETYGTGTVYDGVRTAVARHLNTPIEILEILAEDEEPRVVDAVAANPNTPVHLLELIAQEDADLLLIGAPAWEGSLWITLALREDLPAHLVEKFCVASNPYVRKVAFDHPKATAESKALASLLGFPKSWNDDYYSQFREVNWGAEWRTWDEDSLEEEMIAALATLTPERLGELAADENVNIRRAVAFHPLTPVDLLAADEDQLVRYAISKNPFLTPEAQASIALMGGIPSEDEIDELLSELEESEEDDWNAEWATFGRFERKKKRAHVVMSAISQLNLLENERQQILDILRAQNENLLKTSLINESGATKIAFAENSQTSPKTLQELACDEESGVRSRVAGNPRTPVGSLELLAKDKDDWVRSNVAGNPRTPVGSLELLAKDKDHSVRSNVAGNPNTPLDLLEALSKDKNPGVRETIAHNPNTPVVALEFLAKDKNKSVRLWVAYSQTTPANVLELLAEDSAVDVRNAVAGNPNTPVGSLELLAKDEKYSVRWEVAGNSNTPSNLCKVLAKDKKAEVRETIARNNNTSFEDLKILLKDLNSGVQSAAQYVMNERLEEPKQSQ